MKREKSYISKENRTRDKEIKNEKVEKSPREEKVLSKVLKH